MPAQTLREKFNNEDFLRIVCTGDLQTAQSYSKPSWTDWLQRALSETGPIQTSWRRQVVNTAVERATPKHVQTYFTRYIGDFKPDAVLLSFGVSPLFPEFDQKIFEADLNQLLDLLQQQQTQVVLWSPYPLLSGEKREEIMILGALYKQKSIERNLPFVDIYREFEGIELAKVFTTTVARNNEVYGLSVGDLDGLSLNSIGQYLVAKKLVFELFGVALPTVDAGSFVTPRLEGLKKWG